jgi:hypothetical protein
MFNLSDGSLKIEKYHVSIGRKFRYQDFVNSELYKIANPLVINIPYRSYIITDPISFLGIKFSLTIYFKNNLLERLHLYLFDPDETPSWEQWSEESEIKKLVIQNNLLNKNFGSPPYCYEWGSIESIFDKRSGDTGLIIIYK